MRKDKESFIIGVLSSDRHGVLAVEGAATDPEEDFSGEERMEQEVCQKY